MIGSGVYSAEVIERSSEEPTVAELLFYTVVIYTEDAAIKRAEVTPQRYHRRFAEELGLELMPFDLGLRVPVTVIVQGPNEQVDIAIGEWPKSTPCGGTGDGG